MKRRALAGLLCLLLLGSLTPAGAEELKPGDRLFMGVYEQDNNPENGPEPVEWLVLDAEEERVLLLSRYCLETRPFHSQPGVMQWDGCELRQWMNTEMLNALFTPEEQERVLLTHLEALPHPRFTTDPGGDTDDRLFLLSIQEVAKYFTTKSARQARATKAARAHGAYSSQSGHCGWWLRTTGHSPEDEARVSSLGTFVNYKVEYRKDTVRPAFWMKKDPEESHAD